MSTSLMFVVFACCCFGAFAAQTPAPALSILLTTDNKAQLKCTPSGGSVTGTGTTATDDKFAFYKTGETAVFRDATSAEAGTNIGVKDIDVTAATAGEYFCKFSLTAASPVSDRPSAASASVNLGFGSAAPRIVESMTLTLACLVAAVAKSHM